MKCPDCHCETKKGIVEAAGSSPFSINISFYSDEYKHKIFKPQLLALKNKAESYYCENCHKVFACFMEK